MFYNLGARCMSTLPLFSIIFTKGNSSRDFMFAFLDDRPSQNGIYPYRKEFSPIGAKSYLYVMNLIYMGGKMKVTSVVAPEDVPIHMEEAISHSRLMQLKKTDRCKTPQLISEASQYMLHNI